MHGDVSQATPLNLNLLTPEIEGCGWRETADMVSPNDSFVAGSVAGGVCRLLTAPLDVLKVRLQLQIEPISKVRLFLSDVGIKHTLFFIVLIRFLPVCFLF